MNSYPRCCVNEMHEVVGRLLRFAAFVPVGVTVHDCLFTVMRVPDNMMQVGATVFTFEFYTSV